MSSVDLTSLFDTKTLAMSFDYCRELTKERAKNFYYGLKVVPEPKRSAMFAVYAWMRRADDLVDSEGTIEQKQQRANQFRQQTVSLYNESDSVPDNDQIWAAFKHTILKYEIPVQYLHDMIDGQLQDLEVNRYPNFDSLYDYCYKVASVVGLTSLQVWGYRGGQATRKLAEYRGIAFQLTNILRDILEDAQNDRVYVPAEDFEVYNLSPSMFTLGKPENCLVGLQNVIQRAEHYYKLSAPLENYVSPDGRACLWAMTAIYRGLLDKIAANPMLVLTGERIRLSKFRKLCIAFRASYFPPGGKAPAIEPPAEPLEIEGANS